MAKKDTNDKELLAAFSDLDKINPLATFLSENTLSTVDKWISTGCGALNAIISGDIVNGGIPSGRITLFSGEAASGKSFIINKILANAQKDHGMMPVIFDSEFDKDKAMAEAAGLDPKKVKYVPVGSIEQLTLQMCSFLDKVIENNLQGRFAIAIDSLGNLASDKEIMDVEKGKTTGDMGLRAKEIKKFFRLVTFKCAAAKCPIVAAMHIYASVGDLYPSLVKKMSGGEGPIYMASVGVQMAARKEKQDEDNDQDIKLPEGKNYSGVTLRMLTVKNRFIPPFLAIENYLSFTTGLDKYSGLYEMAINHGVLGKDGHKDVLLPSNEVIGKYKEWRHNEKIWDEQIIPLLNEKLKIAYKYNTVNTLEKVEVEE